MVLAGWWGGIRKRWFGIHSYTLPTRSQRAESPHHVPWHMRSRDVATLIIFTQTLAHFLQRLCHTSWHIAPDMNITSTLVAHVARGLKTVLPCFFTIQLQEEDLIFPTQIHLFHLTKLGDQARTCGGKGVLSYVIGHNFACHERRRAR